MGLILMPKISAQWASAILVHSILPPHQQKPSSSLVLQCANQVIIVTVPTIIKFLLVFGLYV